MISPNPFAAIVFDLDGTLIDSFEDIRVACNRTLEGMGRARLDGPVIRSFVGRGSRRLIASALGVEPDDGLVSEALRLFLEYYENHPADFTKPMPGVVPLLDSLVSVPIAICTNKPARLTGRVLEALGWSSRFGAVVGGGDAEALKPDPRPLELACARLGVSPDRVAMVGDGPEDIMAARAAGAFSVAVLGGFPSEERVRAAAPDLLVPDLEAFSRSLGDGSLRLRQ